MKQKKIGDILYVFDDVPYYIQEDTDATTIYVQEEYLGGYKELNPALAFTPYNYRLLRVTKPEWADYINADDEPVEDQGYSPEAMDLNGRSFMMSSFPNGDIGIAIGIEAEEGSSSSHSLSVDRSELEEQMQGIGASDDNEDDDLVGEYDSDYDPTEVRSEKSVPLNSKIIVTKQGYGQYSFKVALGESNNNDLLTIDYSDTESETATISIDESVDADVLVFGLMNKQDIVPEKEAAGIAFVSSSASIDLKDDSSYIFELSNPNDLVDLTAYASDPSCTVSLNNNNVYATPSATGTYTVYVEFAGDDNYLPAIISATLTVADTTDRRQDPQLSFGSNSYSLDLKDDSTINLTIVNDNNVNISNITLTSTDLDMSLSFNNNVVTVSDCMNTGSFTITASFAGDATWLPATFTTTLVVTDTTDRRQDPQLSFVNQSYNVDLHDGSNASLQITNTYSVDLSGATFTSTDPAMILQYNSNDNTLSVSNISNTGSFTITGSFAGNTDYLPATFTTTLVVTDTTDYRVSPELQFDQPSYSFDLYTDGSTGSISISNPYDIQMSDISFNADGLSYNVSQETGQITYIINLQTGSFTITASFAGDQDYLPQTIYTTMTVSDSTPAPSPAIDYPVSLAESDIQIDQTSTAQDVHTAIANNLSGYSPSSWGVWPYITIVDQRSSQTLVNNIEMYSLSLETAIANALANVSYGFDVWQVIYDIASTTSGGQEYNAFHDSCTFTFVQVQQDQQYGCSLLNNDIQFDPDVSDQDIEDAITGNLDGYDSSWMPEPTITVTYGSGESNIICSDVQMSQLDFSNDMSSITFGSTVWTVYYTIAADDYAGEHYAQEDLEFTITFVDYAPSGIDYPVTLESSTAEIEYEEGSSEANYVSAVSNALMDLLSGYDDSWMPTPRCSIYAPDPEDPNEQVTITEDSEIGGSTCGDDLSAAFQESGAIVVDQTQWSVYISIPASTYAGEDYEQWDGNEVTLSFVSPAVEPLGHFRLTSNQNGSTVAMDAVTGAGTGTPSLDYTTDEGATWARWDFSAITLNEGESICFRGSNNKIHTKKFVLTGNWSATGHIMSLLVGDNFDGATFNNSNANAFVQLFDGCSALYDVSEIILPTNTYNTCYTNMFAGCSNIEKAPYLPATIHASDAYGWLFKNCTKLKYIKFNTSNANSFYNWVSGVAATGIMVNENPDFNASSFLSSASGCPSGWTLLTSDPQNYDASINNSNIDIYPSGENAQYDISDIVNDIQGNLTCSTIGATPSITIPDPNDQGGSNLIINNIELDNGPDLYDAIDNFSQNSGISIGDVWTATISIPQDTIDGTLYFAWQGTFTISFQDNP